MTPEERKSQKVRRGEYERKRRAARTAEQLATLREYQREYQRERRAAMTPKETRRARDTRVRPRATAAGRERAALSLTPAFAERRHGRLARRLVAIRC